MGNNVTYTVVLMVLSIVIIGGISIFVLALLKTRLFPYISELFYTTLERKHKLKRKSKDVSELTFDQATDILVGNNPDYLCLNFDPKSEKWFILRVTNDNKRTIVGKYYKDVLIANKVLTELAIKDNLLIK